MHLPAWQDILPSLHCLVYSLEDLYSHWTDTCGIEGLASKAEPII